MLEFKKIESVNPDLLKKLHQLLSSMKITTKAYLGMVKTPADQAFSPALLIEAQGGLGSKAYTRISDVMGPYFPNMYANVAPIPPGPWWAHIENEGIKVLNGV